MDGARFAPVTVNVSQPAGSGSVVTPYGTGEGLTSPALSDGALVLSSPFSSPARSVMVTTGGQPAEVLYLNAAPTLPDGILQINARIRANISPGNAAVASASEEPSPPAPSRWR